MEGPEENSVHIKAGGAGGPTGALKNTAYAEGREGKLERNLERPGRGGWGSR